MAIENIKKNYDRLVSLPVKSMLVELISERVISAAQKQRINLLDDRDKIEYILDEVIIPELRIGIAKSFKGFIEVMEDSEDIDTRATAKMLGMLICK